MSGLKKTFRTGFLMRPVEAVRHVDLDVAKGAIYGFIGPNGAGKTTVIKMLTGLIRPTRGHHLVGAAHLADALEGRTVVRDRRLPAALDFTMHAAKLVGSSRSWHADHPGIFTHEAAGNDRSVSSALSRGRADASSPW